MERRAKKRGRAFFWDASHRTAALRTPDTPSGDQPGSQKGVRCSLPGNSMHIRSTPWGAASPNLLGFGRPGRSPS